MVDDHPTVEMTDPELWRQPGACFAPWFQEEVRAVRVSATDSVMLFHHADVRDALCDSRLGAMGTRAFEAMGWNDGPFVEWMRRNIVAVEETIRFEPSLIWVARVAREDLELGGAQVARDRLVMLNLAAANRDPAVHPDPDRFDIGRRDIQVLSFGMGAHFCIGASLARLEGQIAYEVLLDRFSDIEFVGEPPRFAAFTALRTLESLEVRVTPA